jgi:hypothetical protein
MRVPGQTVTDELAWFQMFLETFISDPLKTRWRDLAMRGKWEKMSPDYLWKNRAGNENSYALDENLAALWNALQLEMQEKTMDGVLVIGIGDSPSPPEFARVHHLKELEPALPMSCLLILHPQRLAVCFADWGEIRVFKKTKPARRMK